MKNGTAQKSLICGAGARGRTGTGFSAQGILSPDQGSAPLKSITPHRQPSNHLASLPSPASDLFRPMVVNGSGKARAKSVTSAYRFKRLRACRGLAVQRERALNHPALQTQRAQAMRTAAGESEDCCGVDHRIRGQLGRFSPRSRFRRLLRVRKALECAT